MKNRAKIGNKIGNPAYRTASFFRIKKINLVKKAKFALKFKSNKK
jgi:hypothetical protein